MYVWKSLSLSYIYIYSLCICVCVCENRCLFIHNVYSLYIHAEGDIKIFLVFWREYILIIICSITHSFSSFFFFLPSPLLIIGSSAVWIVVFISFFFLSFSWHYFKNFLQIYLGKCSTLIVIYSLSLSLSLSLSSHFGCHLFWTQL